MTFRCDALFGLPIHKFSKQNFKSVMLTDNEFDLLISFRTP